MVQWWPPKDKVRVTILIKYSFKTIAFLIHRLSQDDEPSEWLKGLWLSSVNAFFSPNISCVLFETNLKYQKNVWSGFLNITLINICMLSNFSDVTMTSKINHIYRIEIGSSNREHCCLKHKLGWFFFNYLILDKSLSNLWRLFL